MSGRAIGVHLPVKQSLIVGEVMWLPALLAFIAGFVLTWLGTIDD